LRERRFTLHDHCLKQLGIEARKGSITPGKDADFLALDNDLLTAEQEGFSYNKPRDVYFRGKKMN
jgi:imidazolonepropionase-like amidohydrolase